MFNAHDDDAIYKKKIKQKKNPDCFRNNEVESHLIFCSKNKNEERYCLPSSFVLV